MQGPLLAFAQSALASIAPFAVQLGPLGHPFQGAQQFSIRLAAFGCEQQGRFGVFLVPCFEFLYRSSGIGISRSSASFTRNPYFGLLETRSTLS